LKFDCLCCGVEHAGGGQFGICGGGRAGLQG